VAIEHGVHGADRRELDIASVESLEPFANLRRTPARPLLLELDDARLEL
jgi:hypothetical protein